MTAPRERYTHGHHESVLRSHRWRTAANSAGYLLPYLRSGQDLLDVGCGPGTITLDFARLVAPAQVIGLDAADAPLREAAVDAAEAGLANVSFEVGDAYALSFDDGRFDVVHAHQVLQHLADPVAALAEMRRVTRSGGIVAVRDADIASTAWFPLFPALDRWIELYGHVTRANRRRARRGTAAPVLGARRRFHRRDGIGQCLVLRDRRGSCLVGLALG